MYFFKLLIALFISGSLIGNSVAMASVGLSSRLDGLVASGDVVIDEGIVSDFGLLVVERPEDVEAGAVGFISIPALILAVAKAEALTALYASALYAIDKALDKMADAKRNGDEVPGFFESLASSHEELSTAAKEGIKDDINLLKKLSPSERLKSFGEKLDMLGDALVIASNEYESGGEKHFILPITGFPIRDSSHDDVPPIVAKSQIFSELIKGGEFSSSSDLNHWTSSNAKAGYSSFGDISSSVTSEDQRFGFVHTGLGANSDQGFMLQTVLPLKNSSAVFNARYNFVTTEFPRYLGSQFNDSFVIKIEDVASGATKALASFNGSLNTLFDKNDPVVQNLPAQFLDAVASGGGQTGWITKSSGQIALKSGGKYRIYIDVRDVGDRIVDSALLIDKVSLW